MAAQRPARFLRVEKAVAIPDDKLVDLNNTAFGPNRSQGMREIVAYAPIEPDGSVRVKVPANVALAVSVLDANGRRTTARHLNWLQVIPGQELKCNGCHASTTNFSHGRSDTFDGRVRGRGRHRRAVPEHAFDVLARRRRDDGGDAHARENQIARQGSATQLVCPPKRSIDPSVNLLYCDAWTNPAVRAPDASFCVRLHGAQDDGARHRFELHRELVGFVPNRDQLRGDHSSALGHAAAGPRSDDACGARGPHLQSQGGCHAPTNAMARRWCRPGSST